MQVGSDEGLLVFGTQPCAHACYHGEAVLCVHMQVGSDEGGEGGSGEDGERVGYTEQVRLRREEAARRRALARKVRLTWNLPDSASVQLGHVF